MSLMAFALQVLPVSLMAVAATLIGAALQVDRAWQLPLLLVGLLLFAAFVTFRRASGWNLALLLALAVVAGVVLGSAFGDGQELGPVGALVLTFVLLAVAALIGSVLRSRLRRVGFLLWTMAWVYLVGWVVSVPLDPAAELRAAWAGAGLAIFLCLAVVYFSRLAIGEPGRGLAVAPGSDLYLVGLNVAIALRILLHSLSVS